MEAPTPSLAVGVRRDGYLRALTRFDGIFGLLLPFPLFIQVQGRIGLYSGGFVSEGLSVPIAFLLAPVAFLTAIRPFLRARPMPRVPTLGAFGAVVWITLLGGFSSLEDPRALLYTVQWASPFVMLVYGAAIAYDDRRREDFLNGFVPGAMLAIGYLIALGVLEFLFLGTFRGRMSQNVIVPGMYQLYNYVPLGLVMCGIFAAGVLAGKPGPRSPGLALVLLLATLGVPMLTAARGPVALFGLCAPLIGWRLFGMRGAIWITALPAAVLLLFASESFMLVEKLAALRDEEAYGGTFGNRDEMGRLYWRVYLEAPVLGTRFLPPILAHPGLGIDIKSAHNYYLDALAWGGPVLLMCIALLLFGVLTMSARLILRFLLRWGGRASSPAGLALAALPPVIGILLVNSNLRIPLREPYTGVLGFVMMGILLASGQRALQRDGASSAIT